MDRWMDGWIDRDRYSCFFLFNRHTIEDIFMAIFPVDGKPSPSRLEAAGRERKGAGEQRNTGEGEGTGCLQHVARSDRR